jgi:hypothetical protein
MDEYEDPDEYDDEFENVNDPNDGHTDEELDNMTTEEFMEIPFNKASIFVFGCLQHLHSLGMISLGRDKITPKGIGLFDQLKASGYKPSLDECVTILLVFEVFSKENFMNGLNVLIHLVDLGNDEFEEFVAKHKEKTDEDTNTSKESEQDPFSSGDIDYY